MNTPPSLPRRRSRWRTPLLVLLVLVILVISLGAGGWWWINRPIIPTVLNEGEQQALEQKIAVLQQEEAAPDYVPGDKVIVLTEREINGFLELHELGDRLRFDLGKDALHARLATKIPADSPILPGKTLKGRARFLLTEENGNPSVVLDDVTIWGISLPNAWLGNIKGENLVEAVGDELGNNFIADGIKSLEVNRNEIVILFPEGTRGEPEQMGRVRKGICHLLKEREHVPVVPVVMHGLGRALPRGEALFVPFNCDVVVGEPTHVRGRSSAFVKQLCETYDELFKQCLTRTAEI